MMPRRGPKPGRAVLAATALALALHVPTAPAYDDGSGDEPPDPTRQPQPAEMMPLAARSKLLSIDRAGEQLIAVGERGHILRSSNGEQWSQVASPVRRMLTRVRFFDQRRGWAVGYDAAILRTTDGGGSWSLHNFEAGAWPLFDIYFPAPDYGIAIGARGLILATEDGGASWDYVENAITDLLFTLNRLIPLNDGTLLAVGERGMLLRSGDNGRNWDMLQQPYVGTWFDAIPVGRTGVLLIGLRGHVFHAQDVASLGTEDPLTWDEYAAQSVEDPEALADMGWRRIETGTELGLYAGIELDNGEVLLAGANGQLLRSTDGLTRFQSASTPRRLTVSDLLLDDGRLVTVGRRGTQRLNLESLFAGSAGMEATP